MTPTVAVVATLDTKGGEAAFLRAELRRQGCAARIVDVGLRLVTGDVDVDVPADAIARAADRNLDALRENARRDEAMHVMATGAARVLGGWHAAGELAGVIGIGGNQGTAVAAEAMRRLPFGVPKLIVSTVASGDVRGFVGDSDIALMFSVGDLLGGPNLITTGVLRRAAAAIAGMARTEEEADAPPRPGTVVAVTAFGNTHMAVTTAMEHLRRAGAHPVPFHASGACGSAMERLVAEGMFDAVLDLTTHELLAELYPADIYNPVRPGRLTAAGRCGIPQVVVPGGLDYHCFAAADTIPADLRDRPTHYHNPNNTNVRATAEELSAVAGAMAERLNAATGPVAVLVPLHGWSQVGSPGGVLHDPYADAAFVAELRRALSPRVPLRELDLTINDPVFAATAAETLLSLLGGIRATGPRETSRKLASASREGGCHVPDPGRNYRPAV